MEKTDRAEGHAKETLPKVEGYLPPDIEAKFEFYNFGQIGRASCRERV